MAAKSAAKSKKLEVLTWKKGWMIFAISWVATFAVVWGLRQILIPKEELDCYARVQMFQKADKSMERRYIRTGHDRFDG